MSNDDLEVKYRRQQDLENLSKIPLIEENIKNIQITLDKVLTKIEIYNNIKVDVLWLKKFFWVITSGIIMALIGTLFSLIKK